MSRSSEEAGPGAMRDGPIPGAGGRGRAEGARRALGSGGGRGVTPPYYEGVDSLVVTEPEPAMLRRLQDKAREQAPQAELRRAPAEDLPFGDASFGPVVWTLGLCGVDQERSLAEVRRVRRPGGRRLF